MEHTDYLEDSRVYRSEKDVFDDFTDEEREQYFGQTPTTVYENIQAFERYPAKLKVLQKGHVFTNSILSSFKTASINKWVTEIEYRILPVWRAEIIQTKKLHDSTNETALDQMHWKKVNNLRKDLAKDTQENQSLLTTMKEMIHLKEYLKVSELQKQIDLKMNELQKHYDVYKNNIIE
jgi:glutamine synthetase